MVAKNMNNLKIRDLTVSYNGSNVIENLNLEAKEGELIAIVGKSGCGKTTLLNAISGFLKFEGKIKKSGNIGIVFQNFAVFPWLTVKGNISFGLKHKNRTVDHYIDRIGLNEKKDSYMFELSGGQIQRVALARTLAANPKLILMDEPYGALDVYTREKMQQWLLEIWTEEKKTILFVTHSIGEAIFLADRVLVLKHKKISEEFEIKLARPRNNDIKFFKKFNDLKRNINNAIRK